MEACSSGLPTKIFLYSLNSFAHMGQQWELASPLSVSSHSAALQCLSAHAQSERRRDSHRELELPENMNSLHHKTLLSWNLALNHTELKNSRQQCCWHGHIHFYMNKLCLFIETFLLCQGHSVSLKLRLLRLTLLWRLYVQWAMVAIYIPFLNIWYCLDFSLVCNSFHLFSIINLNM